MQLPVLPTPFWLTRGMIDAKAATLTPLQSQLAANGSTVRAHSDPQLRLLSRGPNDLIRPGYAPVICFSRAVCNHSRSSPYCGGRCDPWWAAPSLLVRTLAASPAKCLTRT